MIFCAHNRTGLREGSVGPEMRSPVWLSAPRKKKRPLRGVEPKMLSSAGLVLRIIPSVATPVNRDAALTPWRCGA